jgi:dolichol-phosphate mannosyltransferase
MDFSVVISGFNEGDIINCFESNDSRTEKLLVNGHRQDRNDTGWRRLSSHIANQVRRTLLSDAIPGSGYGIKAFHQQLFTELPSFNHMHRFLPALVLQQGGQLINLPVSHRERTHGQSKYGTLDRLIAGVVDLCGGMWLARRNIKPEIETRKIINGKFNTLANDWICRSDLLFMPLYCAMAGK